MKLKGILLTSALTAMLGVGVFAGVSGNKGVEKAEALTQGQWRLNVLVSTNSWWLNNGDDSEATKTQVWTGSANVDLGRDSDFTNSSKTYYSTVTLGNTSYYYATYEMSCPASSTTMYFKRIGKKQYNEVSQSISNTDNTVLIDSNGNSSKFGNYFKVILHAGVDNSDVSKSLVNSQTQKYNPTAASFAGYRFDGWYKSSNYAENTKYTADYLTGDLELYAKYTQVPTYTVNFYLDDKTTIYDTVYVPEGGTAACSKSNPTKAQEGGKQYTFYRWENNDGTAADLTNITGNKNVYASFSSSYAAGRYLIGNFGTCSWDVKDIGSAIYVPSTGSQYEVTNVSFSRNDTLKCVYYNGSGYESYYGWSSTRTQCGAYYCFSNDKDDNLVVVASGRYNFYFTDGDFGDGKKISIEINGSSRNAEQLAAKLMSFGPANPGVAGDNSCGNENKFPAMKSMYLNNLSESEQSTFRGYASSNVDQFKNAYDRYVAWAAALGEKPWEEGKIYGAAPMSIVTNDNSTTVTTTATVVTSIIAISTAAGFLFLKKKKNF